MPQLVKLSIFIRRRQGMSLEAFHKYWSEEHPKAVMSIDCVKNTVVKYVQYHADDAKMKALAAVTNTMPWDGAAEFWAHSLEDIVAIFSDPDYLNIVVPDEERFFDKASAQTFVGYEEVKYERTELQK